MKDPARRVFGARAPVTIGASAPLGIELAAIPSPSALVPVVARQLGDINMSFNPISGQFETGRDIFQTLSIVTGSVVAPYVAAVVSFLSGAYLVVGGVAVLAEINRLWGDEIESLLWSVFGPAAEDLEYVYARLLPLMTKKMVETFMESKITDLGEEAALNLGLRPVQDDSRTIAGLMTDEQREMIDQNDPVSDPFFLENLSVFAKDNPEVERWAKGSAETTEIAMILRAMMGEYPEGMDRCLYLYDKKNAGWFTETLMLNGKIYQRENFEKAVAALYDAEGCGEMIASAIESQDQDVEVGVFPRLIAAAMNAVGGAYALSVMAAVAGFSILAEKIKKGMAGEPAWFTAEEEQQASEIVQTETIAGVAKATPSDSGVRDF